VRSVKEEKDRERYEIVQKVKEIEAASMGFRRDLENDIKELYKTMMSEFQIIDRRIVEDEHLKNGRFSDVCNKKIEDNFMSQEVFGLDEQRNCGATESLVCCGYWRRRSLFQRR